MRSLSPTTPAAASRDGFLVSGFGEAQYHELVERADHFYVAYRQERLAGFVVACSDDRIRADEWLNRRLATHLTGFVVIKQVCVDRAQAGQGVATALYEHIIVRTAGRPLAAAVVTEPVNLPSMALHRKLRFEPAFTLTPPDGRRRVVLLRRTGHTVDQPATPAPP